MMHVSFDDQQKCLKSLANFYKVKLRFIYMDDHANVDLKNEIIYLSKYTLSYGIEFSLSCFFHELGHLICKQTGKFKIFHQDEETLSKSQQKTFIKTMWEAEEYVDKIGKRILEAHFPGFKYATGYNKRSKKIFFPIMIHEYKEYFKYLNNKKVLKK